MQFSSKKSVPLSIAVLGFVAFASGCAAPITREAIVPGTFETKIKHSQSVSAEAKGAEAAGSRVSDTTLTEALIDSITKSQVFSRAIAGKGGDYLLDVTVFKVERPMMAGDVTIKMEAGWTLRRADTGAVVWQESIRSSHTATMGEALVGATRWRLAEEGTVRNNIKTGLDKISTLNF
jgi:hypothetical protein